MTPLIDCAVIGGGPAGLAVARSLHQDGRSYTVYDQGPIGWHIAQYPTFMRFFSTRENLEIGGFPIGIVDEKPSRAQYLKYLSDFARFFQLNVETYTKVVGVARQDDGTFEVQLERPGARRSTVRARSVVAAVGAWDMPRRLDGVPGAELDKVRYRFTEPHEYVGRKVLVVGGRNSSIETALVLWRAGADVTISYRGTEFTGRGVKYWLKPDIDNRIANGEIAGYLGSHVRRVGWEDVDIETQDGKIVTIENDFVIAHLGYDPPVKFLSSLGITMEEGTNRPVHNEETLESNIPGLFVAGVITYGNISGHVFIENSRHHGELILPRLREIIEEQKSAAV